MQDVRHSETVRTQSSAGPPALLTLPCGRVMAFLPCRWRGTDYVPDLSDIEYRVGKMKVLDADARIFLVSPCALPELTHTYSPALKAERQQGPSATRQPAYVQRLYLQSKVPYLCFLSFLPYVSCAD